MRGSRKGSYGQALFRLVNLTHMRSFPPFLGMMTGFANHSGYRTSQTTPASYKLRVSWTMNACFSVDCRRAFYFTGRTFGNTLRWCSIIPLGIPTRSLGSHTNTSLLAHKKLTNALS